SIEWTLGFATVTYEGRTKRTPWWASNGSRGVIFLPIQYTELRTSASATPHHYFELFWWEPSAAQWTLRGRLFELYRDELGTVGSTDALTTVPGAEPPSLTSSDLDAMMNVRLNADGAVEWTTGVAPRVTRPITTRAEALAAREKERARAEADARIDWNAVLD